MDLNILCLLYIKMWNMIDDRKFYFTKLELDF